MTIYFAINHRVL